MQSGHLHQRRLPPTRPAVHHRSRKSRGRVASGPSRLPGPMARSRRNRPFTEPRLPGPTPRTGNRRSRENPGLSGGAIRLVGAVPGAGRRGSCTTRPGSLLPLLVTCGAITALIQLGRLTSAHRADREAVVVRDDRVRRSQGPTKRSRRAAIDKGVRRSIACVRLAL